MDTVRLKKESMNPKKAANKASRRESGFTLMEMLTVVMIVAIIVSVSLPVLSGLMQKSREERDISLIKQAAAKYEADGYIDGGVPELRDGEAVSEFIGEVLPDETDGLYFINDGGFGALPIAVSGGYAYITYKPRLANDKKEVLLRLKLVGISREDQERAPAWTPQPPIIPEPAE